MADLSNHQVYKNTKYEILTDEGFKPFRGLIVGKNKNKILIEFNNYIFLQCTPKHKIMISKTKWRYAKDLKIGDRIYSGTEVTNIQLNITDEDVYEILDVAGIHRYYVNDILCHQCLILDELAFIEPASILEDFWRSVYPTISSSKKSKVLISSTPNGVGNLFHRIWSGAVSGENGFAYDEVKWDEIPGRDEKWRDKQIKNMGSYENWLQEYENIFLQHGDGAIDYEFFDTLTKNAKQPIHIYEDGNYVLYDEPKPDRIYVAGVDTAEGVGKDSSIINIFDITNLQKIEQVAIYASNKISPFEFTTKVNELLTQWGKPLAFVERNGVGAQVADNLRLKLGYERIVNWGGKTANREQQNGIICHTNTKFKGITNMRYWVNELKVVQFNDIQTIKEFKDFIRYPNGSWAARSGSHDDRVMSTVWALISLHDEICNNIFEVIETDDNKKPKVIAPFELNMNLVINPQSLYMDDYLFNNQMSTLPCVFGGPDQSMGEIEELKQQGWTTYE